MTAGDERATMPGDHDLVSARRRIKKWIDGGVRLLTLGCILLVGK
jgi:hypothetical protein